MGLFTRVKDALTAASSTAVRLGDRALYKAFQSYYHVVKLWDYVRASETEPTSLDLRSPVNRLVEFYVAHVWPGTLPDALPIEFEDENEKAEAVRDAIHQIWTWSNWNIKKQWAIRNFATNGDMVLKIVSDDDEDGQSKRVYLQVIDSTDVTSLEVNNRGIIQYIRLDISRTRRNEKGDEEAYTHTEIWDSDGMRIWEHTKGESASIRELGNAIDSRTLAQAGVQGFIPFVHAPFRDNGEGRGRNAFLHATRKIDEANALVTQLHSSVFRYKKPLWALMSDAKDTQGRPLPPPRLTEDGLATSTEIDLSGEKFVSVSGTLQCLVPDINLADALATVDSQVAEIKQDLPELLYYEIAENTNQLATATVRLMLAPAISRILEARANAESALARANMIALTMAQNLTLDKFSAAEIGTYATGEFQHTFEEREVLPLTDTERAEIAEKEAKADTARNMLGIPLRIILEERGYTDEEIDRIFKLQAEEQKGKQTAADLAIDAAMRRFDQGAGEVEEVTPEEEVEA